jgi:hypothetical protein
MKIKLIERIKCYSPSEHDSFYEIGDIFEEDAPYMGFNTDGSFTICSRYVYLYTS